MSCTGSDRLMMTVYSSGVSMLVIQDTLSEVKEDSAARSRVNLTSLAFSSSPLWNFTPLRRTNFHWVGLTCS